MRFYNETGVYMYYLCTRKTIFTTMTKKEKLQHQILQNTSLILIIVSLIIVIVSLVSCSKNDNDNEIGDETENSEYRETMFQVSTLQALLDGGYDGYITVGELRKHGDIGVGTFDKIDGEMIVVDGTVYQARYDGSVRVADDNLTTPFANVTHFDRDITVTLPKVTSMDDLTNRLNEVVKAQDVNKVYVARMDIADCESIHVRSELPQQKPYRPLMEVLKTEQREFTYTNIGGTIVALYFPDFFDKQNSTGWHLHFLSADKTKGGHVFDITTNDSVTVHIDATPYYKLYMP